MSLSRRLGFPTSTLFSGFDDFFSPPSFSQDFSAVPFLTDVRRDPDMVLRRSSPCYEVTENDKQYQLAIDVPGVKLKDIEIELEQDRVLRISGGRKVHKTEPDGTVTASESKFEKRFVMDQSIDTSKVTASLQDGVLTISAPKNIEHSKVHKIAITEGPTPMVTEGGDNPQTSK